MMNAGSPPRVQSLVPRYVLRKTTRSKLLLVAVICGLLCVAAQCSGQFSSGIRGTVTDPGGGTVAGAAVSVTNLSTEVTQNSTTDSTGSFDFRSLAPAEY